MFGTTGDMRDSRWTPAIEEPPQGCLFGIIRNVWPKAIDSTTKVPVGAPNNVRSCHEGSQWEENCSDRSMCQVPLEISERFSVGIFPGTYCR